LEDEVIAVSTSSKVPDWLWSALRTLLQLAWSAVVWYATTGGDGQLPADATVSAAVVTFIVTAALRAAEASRYQSVRIAVRVLMMWIPKIPVGYGRIPTGKS
jgi:hypothetical protein